jgi:hypothetical protein
MATDNSLTCAITGKSLKPGKCYRVMFRDKCVGDLSQEALTEFVRYLRFMLYLDFRIIPCTEDSPGIVDIKIIGDWECDEFKQAFQKLMKVVGE